MDYKRANFFFSFVLLLCAISHAEKTLGELESDIEAIRDDHTELIPFMMNSLREGILKRLQDIKEKGEVTQSPESIAEEKRKAIEVDQVLKRLDKLDHNIALLESFVNDEKMTDDFLVSLDRETGQSFDDDMAQVKSLASSMRDELEQQLEPIDVTLNEVQTTANDRNVAIGGILYYERVGSSCARDNDICITPGSECRDGMCRCWPGRSSDALNQVCVEKCDNGYGETYQTVSNYAIRGYNNVLLENTTLDVCKAQCNNEMTFTCRSFDYFPDWHSCYLSEKVKGDTEDEDDYDEGDYNQDDENANEDEKRDGWEYNSAGIYFQRDCVVDRN